MGVEEEIRKLHLRFQEGFKSIRKSQEQRNQKSQVVEEIRKEIRYQDIGIESCCGIIEAEGGFFCTQNYQTPERDRYKQNRMFRNNQEWKRSQGRIWDQSVEDKKDFGWFKDFRNEID